MQKDVARLRSAIQALTSNVVPVIKVLDFIPEDIEAMWKELEMWRVETQFNASMLETEERSDSVVSGKLVIYLSILPLMPWLQLLQNNP